jgi:hypothetical protein
MPCITQESTDTLCGEVAKQRRASQVLLSIYEGL